MPVGFPATQSGVEIRILQNLFTPEEVEMALQLRAVPEPASVVTFEELPRALDIMAEKGLLLRLDGSTDPDAHGSRQQGRCPRTQRGNIRRHLLSATQSCQYGSARPASGRGRRTSGAPS
jgi:hypothetical protein